MSAAVPVSQGLRYGAMGFALAFVALPLYVLLPQYHAQTFGVSLATLGAVLLVARLFDAVVDPWIGRWCDTLYARSWRAVGVVAALSALILALGFAGLFFPPMWARSGNALVLWIGAFLTLTYTAYSTLTVLHQAFGARWGAEQGGGDAVQARLVGWREGFGLLGVVVASVLPVALGVGAGVVAFVLALVLGGLLWALAQKPKLSAALSQAGAAPVRPWASKPFQKLMAVFLLNGIASAVPATLFLFFVQDRLQAAPKAEGPLLALYFVCAALSMPVWLRAVARFGLARVWCVGMLLSIVVFVWASRLGAGDMTAFAVICALSGAALGTDLALPSALLLRVVAQEGHSGSREGAYLGWWNFATKLNLALAAGLSLPALQWLGYAPGVRTPEALMALTAAYCILPCVLKSFAAWALYVFFIRKSS